MGSRYELALAFAAIALSFVPAQAQKAPQLPDIMQSVGNYLVEYSRHLGAVEAEEALTQRETSGNTLGTGHTWKAELVLLGMGNGSVSTLRDVFELESSKTRDRDDRLFRLFKADPKAAWSQGQELTDASAKLALTPAMVAFNTPMLALEFLRKENQPRSAFKLDSVKTMNGAQVAILKFTEQSKPHLLPGTDDGAMLGRVWIDTSSGAVRQTELIFTNRSIDVHTTVVYAVEPKIRVWLPVTLDATYGLSSGGSGSATIAGKGSDNNAYGSHQTMEAQVRYSKFQQTAVDLDKLAK